MALRLTFSILGEEQVVRTLDGIRERATDMRPAWDAVADIFEEANRRQFSSEGAYGGAGWAPLSEKYGAWKLAHYGPVGILHRTGEMELDLTSQPFGIDIRELNQAIYGTAAPYAIYHQQGGDNLPQRRVVSLPEADRRAIVKAVQRHIVEGP